MFEHSSLWDSVTIGKQTTIRNPREAGRERVLLFECDIRSFWIGHQGFRVLFPCDEPLAELILLGIGATSVLLSPRWRATWKFNEDKSNG